MGRVRVRELTPKECDKEEASEKIKYNSFYYWS